MVQIRQFSRKLIGPCFFLFTGFISIGTVASSLGIGQLLGELCLSIVAKFGNNVVTVFGLIFAIVFGMNF